MSKDSDSTSHPPMSGTVSETLEEMTTSDRRGLLPGRPGDPFQSAEDTQRIPTCNCQSLHRPPSPAYHISTHALCTHPSLDDATMIRSFPSSSLPVGWMSSSDQIKPYIYPLGGCPRRPLGLVIIPLLCTRFHTLTLIALLEKAV